MRPLFAVLGVQVALGVTFAALIVSGVLPIASVPDGVTSSAKSGVDQVAVTPVTYS